MLNKKIGKLGEEIAKKYYKNLGYQVISQNFYTPYGELDLVLQKNNIILVVEVKTRTKHSFGWAEETINSKKLANIDHTYYILQVKKDLPEHYLLEICIIELIAKKATIKRIKA